MKVVILCGGQGTRLREETEYIPKPLVNIGGRPILWHIMKLYSYHGFNDFILCLGYKGHLIKEYFLNYEAMNNDFTITLGKDEKIEFHKERDDECFKITLADTGLETMTGSRIKQIEKYIDSDTFMVTYGDGLSNVNIRQLVDFHKAHGHLATVTAVHPTSRFGILNLTPNAQVLNFDEKPLSNDWINSGFFVFNENVFSYLSTAPACTLERGPLENLAQDGEMRAFQHNGFFFAMDTYREYLQLNDIWRTGEAPWAVWNTEPATHV